MHGGSQADLRDRFREQAADFLGRRFEYGIARALHRRHRVDTRHLDLPVRGLSDDNVAGQ